MESNWLRPLKGFLIFVAFIGIGLSLQHTIGVGLMAQLKELEVSITVMSYIFYLSGVMSLISGLRRWNWNAAWISVFVFYTILVWVASIKLTGTISSSPIAFALLSLFLTIDVVNDLLRGRNGRTFKEW